MSAGCKCGLFLDRDGIINHDNGYLHKIEACRFVDDIFALTRAFAERGLVIVIVIVTNQAGIGRGYDSGADFQRLMDWMTAEFARHGVPIAAVSYCPDHPTEGVGPYRRHNCWRKPGPGMFLQAAADLALDCAHSWSIGDKMSDIEAGRAAAVANVVLYDPAAGATKRASDHWVVPGLAAVLELLQALEAQGGSGTSD